MNYRTSNCPDYVVNDCINVGDVLPDDYVTDVPVIRCCEDTGNLNNYGSLLLDLCKQTGLRILNGRCCEDKQGLYTYIGPRGSSLVDYVVTSQNLIQHVGTFKVKDPNIMSDHCMVDFSLNFNIRNFDQGDECYSSNRNINSKYV